MEAVAQSLARVQDLGRAAMAERPEPVDGVAMPEEVRLVAVSKTKPVEMLKAAYGAGHRHFGENYARTLNKAVAEVHGPEKRLRVMVQVNSSSEESKSGVTPESCVELCKAIAADCGSLELAGLMTIGAPDYSGCRTEDFETLHRCRSEVAAALECEAASLELSMGMSSDFERAIKEGSTSVRVGSAIFGARHYQAK